MVGQWRFAEEVHGSSLVFTVQWKCVAVKNEDCFA
jgi:hypothetical protein